MLWLTIVRTSEEQIQVTSGRYHSSSCRGVSSIASQCLLNLSSTIKIKIATTHFPDCPWLRIAASLGHSASLFHCLSLHSMLNQAHYSVLTQHSIFLRTNSESLAPLPPTAPSPDFIISINKNLLQELWVIFESSSNSHIFFSFLPCLSIPAIIPLPEGLSPLQVSFLQCDLNLLLACLNHNSI